MFFFRKPLTIAAIVTEQCFSHFKLDRNSAVNVVPETVELQP